ncbi:MAG: VTT domain-containing protein [Candidatus Diapherotrites archaeon]|nr:VTT domain-containing protein [Candidatus Diapherotrites archaeon]
MASDILSGFLSWFSTTGASTIAQFGLLGIFATAIALNATVFFGIPMEILLIAFYYSTRIDPLIIALAAGSGAAIGEMIIFYAGWKSKWLSGKVEKSKSKLLQKVRREINAKGPIAEFILFVIPLPIDFVGIMCGIMKMNPLKFFLTALIAKIARYYLVMALVVWGIGLIARLFGFG